MGNPANPAPLEEVAVEYIAQAAISLGIYREVTPQAAMITKTFYKAIYRGLTHFYLDHAFVLTTDETISIEGSPVDVKVRTITNEDSAWKNE